MKTKLLPIILLLGVQAFAQQGVFALTGKQGNSIILNDIREIDLKTNLTKATLLTANDDIKVISASTKKVVPQIKGANDHAQAQAIASLAYDTKNGKTVYMPLYSTNIFVIDNATKAVTLVETNNIKTTACDLGSQFTRMTAGADGAIYAVSNSGSQWLKMSYKNGRYSVVDLGEIKDDVTNGTNSLKVVNIGYGGDMVADTDNNLYLISASAHVFKVNGLDNTAKFIGKIKGLPEGFTLNGAAVNESGSLVLASAKGGKLFTATLDQLDAQPIENSVSEPIYDLASSFFLNQNRVVTDVATTVNADIYPTRVSDKVFNVRVEGQGVSVEIYDASGQLASKSLLKNLSGKNTYEVAVDHLKTGMYLVNLLDADQKQILSKKILVTK